MSILLGVVIGIALLIIVGVLLGHLSWDAAIRYLLVLLVLAGGAFLLLRYL